MSLSELLKDLQADINVAIKLEKKLKDEKFINEIKTVLKIVKIGFIDAAGNALHRLHETKPTIDAVKELIQGFPDALSLKNKRNRLPIQSAVWSSDATTLKYVPILAKEGIKHEVGGRGMCGGLLVVDRMNSNQNSLQFLARLGNSSDQIPYDTPSLEVMKELRKDSLLLKEDIREHDLLFWSCDPQSKRIFEYLAEWDPDCLMTGTIYNLPLSHAIIQHCKNITFFTMYFQTALRHYPQHLGFLFQKDNSGKTAYERTVKKHGTQETFKTILLQCIPTDTSLPILHHVIKDAPQYTNDFTPRYPSAISLRDDNGRSFIQAQLAGDVKTLVTDGLFFLRLSDDEIAEADPVTKQYPFLTAASGESGDLSTAYFLLSKNPSLLERYKEEATQQALEEQEARMARKRTIGDGDNEEGE